MNLLGNILLACLLIAALQGILAVLAVGVVLLLLWGLITRPAETIPLLLLFAVLAGLGAHPLETIATIAALGGLLWITARKKRTRGRTHRPVALLPPPDPDAGDGRAR
jgi:hypothetical protein